MPNVLGKILSKKERALVPASFDVVGDILIFADFPEGLHKKEKEVAKCFLEFYKNVNVVCRKTKKHSGLFRTPRLKILGGQKRKETTYRENNCLMKLNVESCYFSPRLATERKRIASQVRPGETVLVPFSGVAPYPLVISKNSGAKTILGVEKNPVANAYAEGNMRLNKVANVKLHKGDVRRVLPQVRRKFDRVIMPLPKGAGNYLDVALPKLKKGGTLHFYDFLREGEFTESGEKIFKACEKLNRKCKLLRTVKCGQYSPRTYRICVDCQVD